MTTWGDRIVEDVRWRSVRAALRHEDRRAGEATEPEDRPPEPGPPAEPTPGRSCRRGVR
jgi:hypothetical protein